MRVTTEFSIRMENRPGSLAKVCEALAQHGVNIIAFQSIPSQRSVLLCIVTDNPLAAQSALDGAGIIYAEAEVVQEKLANHPGELARVAKQLGEANVNINYAYFGVEPDSNAPLVILGITDVGRAIGAIERTARAATS
ncbi:MAG TPA: ACT domain-containing protein [Candidatus Cybelea sp.]|nr:ACT domain-containing protein [Candidatus Cybelea sp.]